MLDPDRRKKMISLRLSEEEYELLKTSYHTHGARNVSDLARQALHHIMTGDPVIMWCKAWRARSDTLRAP